jgi:hypothetical protein
MTQDDIIRMADASGISYYGMGKDRDKFLHYLEAFANLVAAQPAQEPVACRFCHSEKGCWTWQCYHCGEIDDVQKPAPPAAQHPWQGLTPEDVKHLYPYGRSVWGKETFEAIEKALKDKNT